MDPATMLVLSATSLLVLGLIDRFGGLRTADAPRRRDR